MARIILSQQDEIDLLEALDDPYVTPRNQKKLLTIRMSHLGVPHTTIAKTLAISNDTVTNYTNLYTDEGLPGLLENKYYKPISSVEDYLDEISADFKTTPVADTSEAANRIEKISGTRLSDSQAGRIMKRLGMSYRKTASVPGEADEQLQFNFLEEELLPRLEEAKEGKRRVFFVDASHFVMGAFLGMIWCFGRIFVQTGNGRQRYSVLGAVETRDHDFVDVRTEGSVNAETVMELLTKISKQYIGESITLVMDNARYQRNAKVVELATSLDIELLYLPPYSPNLNLIERVWKLVKKKCLRNKYHGGFGEFKNAIALFIDSLADENRHLLKSLITEKFQLFNSPKT